MECLSKVHGQESGFDSRRSLGGRFDPVSFAESMVQRPFKSGRRKYGVMSGWYWTARNSPMRETGILAPVAQW